MRSLLALLLTVISTVAAETSTIYGTLLTPNGLPFRTVILFESRSTPGSTGTNAVANYTVLARSDTNGFFTTNLVVGTYKTTVKGASPWPDSSFYITVATNGGSYDISTLMTNTLSAPVDPIFIRSDKMTTKGDLLTRDTNSVERLPVGTIGQVLMVDPSEPTGLKWATSFGAATNAVSAVASNGVTIVTPATSLNFIGATVADGSNGVATVTVQPGSGTNAYSLSLTGTAWGPLTVATNWLVVTNGRAGIGTNTPSTELEVHGTAKATALQGDISGTTWTNQSWYSVTNSTGGPMLVGDVTTADGLPSYSRSYYGYNTSGVKGWYGYGVDIWDNDSALQGTDYNLQFANSDGLTWAFEAWMPPSDGIKLTPTIDANVWAKLSADNVFTGSLTLNGGTNLWDWANVTTGAVAYLANAQTFSAAQYSSAASASNAPAGNEFPTANWVRSLFMVGTPMYGTTNIASGIGFTTSTVYELLNDIPSYNAVFTASGITNGQYVLTMISTQLVKSISSTFAVDFYMGENAAGSLSVHPELYYIYSPTNATLLGDWEAQPQAVGTGTNLYQWVISPEQVTSTNADGFYLVVRLKASSVVGSPTITVRVGTNAPSHVHGEIPTLSGGDVYLANDNVFTGTSNLFSGNVGIGMVPTFKLDVYGTIRAQDSLVSNAGSIQAADTGSFAHAGRSKVYSPAESTMVWMNYTDTYTYMANTNGTLYVPTNVVVGSGTNLAGWSTIPTNTVLTTNDIFDLAAGTNILFTTNGTTLTINSTATAGTNTTSYSANAVYLTCIDDNAIIPLMVRKGADNVYYNEVGQTSVTNATGIFPSGQLYMKCDDDSTTIRSRVRKGADGYYYLEVDQTPIP